MQTGQHALALAHDVIGSQHLAGAAAHAVEARIADVAKAHLAPTQPARGQRRAHVAQRGHGRRGLGHAPGGRLKRGAHAGGGAAIAITTTIAIAELGTERAQRRATRLRAAGDAAHAVGDRREQGAFAIASPTDGQRGQQVVVLVAAAHQTGMRADADGQALVDLHCAPSGPKVADATAPLSVATEICTGPVRASTGSVAE